MMCFIQKGVFAWLLENNRGVLVLEEQEVLQAEQDLILLPGAEVPLLPQAQGGALETNRIAHSDHLAPCP